MDTKVIIALVVFVVSYVGILSNRVHRTVAALLGGCTMVLLGAVGQDAAFKAVDLNVIFLLAGMMVIVHFLGRSGFFGYVAIRLAQLVNARPVPMLLVLCVVTAVLSALVDNVTTVLLIAPVTFLIADQLTVSPIPFIVFLAMASNVGGTATLVGDPPNIMIGSAAKLNFTQFLINLTPASVVCMVALLGIAWLVVRKHAQGVSADRRARVMDMDAVGAINDMKLLKKTLCVLTLVFTMFFVHHVFHIRPAVIALAGAGLLLLWTRADPEEAFRSVEWTALFFFVGLFMMVKGLEVNGVLDYLAKSAVSLTGNDLMLTAMMILWFAAVASALVDNIPVVATLIPVVQGIIPSIVDATPLETGTVAPALWWSLALGACLGGNGTMYGAAANVVAVQIAENNDHPITFGRFFAYSLPVTLVTLIIASVYTALRYVL